MPLDPAERDAAPLLAPVRDVPVPPSSVTAADGVRLGRRSARRRAALGTACAVLAVALVMSLGTLAVRRLHLSAPPASGSGTFDPLRQALTVGSAGGFTPLSYQTGRYWQRVVLHLATDTEPGYSDPLVTLTVYPAGRLPGGWNPHGTKAPAVYGRTAYWVSPSATGVSGTELAWKLSTGAWVFADLNRTGSAWRDRLSRVALGVKPADTAVRVPFTVPRGLTDAFGPLYGVFATIGADTSRAAYAVVFRGYDANQFSTTSAGDTYVGVQLNARKGPLLGDPWTGVGQGVASGGYGMSATGAVHVDIGSGYSAVVVDARGNLGIGVKPSLGASRSVPPSSSSSSSTSPSPDPSEPASPSPSATDRGPSPSPTPDALLAAITAVSLVAHPGDQAHWARNPLR